MKKYIIYTIFDMNKKKAVLKYKPNTFEVIEEGDSSLCYFKKKIPLENLNYWNVELQEAYYSPVEVKIKYEELKKKIIISNDYVSRSIDQGL